MDTIEGDTRPDRSRLLIVANRLPVTARWQGGQLKLAHSAGGLAVGLNQLRATERGVWVGWPGDGPCSSPERTAELDRRLAADALQAVHLTHAEINAYYDGFSNGVIWPLFHYLLDRIPIDSANWNAYHNVNRRFAIEVAKIWRPGDRIWVHDYHLMLLPSMLRHALPDARIGFFLHIPFPSLDVFRTLPWRRPLIEGLLGANVIGFHTASYVDHFLAAARRLAGAEPAGDHLWWHNRSIRVGAFPMGVDDKRFAELSDRTDVRARAETIRNEAHGRRILLGIDRLDYTKGIPRRLVAFQRLLERDASLRDRVRLIQVAVPSRIDVGAYKAFRREIDELIGRINGAFGTVDAVPIHYLYRSISPRELVALYRAADVMLVTPLRDGMNLVAKEFVASRSDEDGVLVLSEFAGAAAELTDALIVNPYDADGVADAMARALAMDTGEKQRRMRAQRAVVAGSSVHVWAHEFLRCLGSGLPDATRAATAAVPDAHDAVASGRIDPSREQTLLLDYDGTLVAFAGTPDLAAPDPELLNLLAALAAQPRIALHLVSGRPQETLDRWFAGLPIGLWAEHGAAYRWPNEHAWTRLVPPNPYWIARARPVLDALCARVPGSVVEVKATGLAWHYRMADPAIAERALEDARQTMTEGLPEAELLEGRLVLELRPRGVSKALVVREVVARAKDPGVVVAIGDDQTDEEMFAALPPGSVAIRVGTGTSLAAYRLAGPAAVRRFLTDLLVPRGGRRSSGRRASPLSQASIA